MSSRNLFEKEGHRGEKPVNFLPRHPIFPNPSIFRNLPRTGLPNKMS
jgi:hypothetical protein